MSETGTISSSEILRHVDFVRTLARALTDDGFLADDLAQDALLSAIENPPAEGANLKAWFTVVVKNRWRFLLRSRRRRDDTLRRFVERTEGDLAERSANADPVRGQSGSPDLARSFLALAPRYREVLLLRYWKDMPPREIATELEVPLHTVKTRLQRGLARLRERQDNFREERRWSPLYWLGALTDRIAEWGPRGARLSQLQLLGVVVVVTAAPCAWILAEEDEGEQRLQEAVAALENPETVHRTAPGPEPEPNGIPRASVPGVWADENETADGPGAPVPHQLLLRGERGQTLAGARVWLGDRVLARADDEGVLVFAARPDDLLRFDHEGHLSRSARAADLGEELRLAPAYRYDLVVRDRSSGRPLSDVQYQVRHSCVLADGRTPLFEGRPVAIVPGRVYQVDQHCYSLDFDERGCARAPMSPNTSARLQFRAPGYVTTVVPTTAGERGSERLVVEMVPASRLELVAPETGVYYVRWRPVTGYGRDLPRAKRLRLAAGDVADLDLPPGRYRITVGRGAAFAEAADHELDTFDGAEVARRAESLEFFQTELAPRQVRRREIFAETGRRLFLRGDDLVGATTELTFMDAAGVLGHYDAERHPGRSRGAAHVFSGVGPGRYQLRLRRDGVVERELELEIAEDAGPVLSLELRAGECDALLRSPGSSDAAWWVSAPSTMARAEGPGIRLVSARMHAWAGAEGLCLSRAPRGQGELYWVRGERMERRPLTLSPGRHVVDQADGATAAESFRLKVVLEKARKSFRAESMPLRDEAGRRVPVAWNLTRMERGCELTAVLPRGRYWLGDTSGLGRVDDIRLESDLVVAFARAPYLPRHIRLVDEQGRPVPIMPVSMRLAGHPSPVVDGGLAGFRGSSDRAGEFRASIRPQGDYVIELADGRCCMLTAEVLAAAGEARLDVTPIR